MTFFAFGICLFTGCWVLEAAALQTTDIQGGALTFRKSTTKGKLKTCVVDIQLRLAALLTDYQPAPMRALFPGMRGRKLTLTRFMADKILRAAFKELGIEGASTHSFRRTGLTQMHRAGVPLKVIQKISSHKTLSALQKYLEVLDEDLGAAISTLRF